MKGSGNQSLHWEVDNDSTTLMSRGYQYDPAGNITHRNTEDGPWQYGYDKLNRLTKVTPPEALTTANTLPEEQYAYDAVGNRTASLHQPGTWQYNQDNQLLQWGTDSDLTALTWTAAGQTHTQSYAGQTRTHHYDATQRLIQVKDDSANLASYRYDPMGRRISKSVNGQTTWYLYSGEGMIAELDSAGKIIKGYGWQPDTSYGTAPLWQAEAQSTNQLSTATLHWLHTDHLGTPQMATDKQGNQTWKGQAEAFGKTTPDSSSLITMNLRFPGQYLDGETNTHYNWHRDYSPAIGRYIQVDPIGLNGGENLYGYVGGNSIIFLDLMGLHKGDKWFGYNDKDFKWWYHRCFKEEGAPDATKEDMMEAFQEWKERGSPKRADGKCDNTPPPPPPAPAGCGDTCQKVVFLGALVCVGVCIAYPPCAAVLGIAGGVAVMN